MTTNYINQRREEERSNAITESNSDFLSPLAAGLGAILVGAAIFSGRLRKTSVADALHYLGHGRATGLPRGIDKAAGLRGSTTTPSTVRSVASAKYNVTENRLQLGPIDLIRDLKNTLDVLGNTKVGIAEKIAANTTEFIHRRNLDIGPYNSFYGQDLQRVTAGAVLSDAKSWMDLIGSQQFETLRRARNLGLISNDVILDKNIFLRNKPNALDIVDTRLSSVFSEKSVLGRLTGGVDFFGQAGVFKSLVGSSTQFAVLPELSSEINKSRGVRFFIGGTVYAYDRMGAETIVAKNRKLRLAGDSLEAVSNARQNRLKTYTPGIVDNYLKTPEKYAGAPVDKIFKIYENNPALGRLPLGIRKKMIEAELKTGVGFGYAVRPTFIGRFISNPIRRLSSIIKGEGTVYRHRFGVKGKTSKVVDSALGADVPEVVSNRGEVVRIPNGGQEINYSSLSIWNKLGVLFDLKDDYSVIKRSSLAKAQGGKYILANKDLVVPIPEGGLSSMAKPFNSRLATNLSDAQNALVTRAGDVMAIYRSRYYDVEKSRIPGLTNLGDFFNYLFYRVNSLASDSLLGISFAPGKSALGTATKLAAIPLIYKAGIETFEYLDYISEKTTGISPKKLLADVYANSRLAQQKFREAIGLQQSFASIEENFPGSVDSEGSFFIRSLIAPAIGFSLGLKRGARSGVGLAALAYAAVGGPSPGQTSEDLQAEYAGEKKVPVRKGRFWGSGYQPFFGAQPEYFTQSWYFKLKNDISYIGKYGSKDEYFKYHQNVFGIPLPTPTNILGLNNIVNPYRWEEMNSQSRPYPVVSNNLINFPIFGPVLSATVGSILKPARYNLNGLPLLKAGLVDRGLQPSAAMTLGIPARDASEIQLDNPGDPSVRLRQMLNVALEPIGLYKFVMEYYGVDLKETNPRLASSDIALSEGRGFYEQALGGMFGSTELLRRFMLSDYYSTYNISRLVNNLPNNMPTFLPGSRSEYIKDQTYMKDFTVGDPYTLLPEGELRLPGKAYDLINKKHSDVPGQYDDVDKFLMLADVAPYSAAFTALQDKVTKMKLDDYWFNKVQQAIVQRNQVIGVDDRYERLSDKIIDMNLQTKGNALYRSMRDNYDTFTHDFLAEIPYLGSKLFPFRNPYEQYRKHEIEGAPFASWTEPYENIIRPMYYDVALSSPLIGAMKGAAIGGMLYGPYRFFSPFKNVEASLTSNLVYGAGIGGALSMERILTGKEENYIPEHIQKESAAIEYMDKFTYIKNRMFTEMGGDPYFAKAARKTMVGASSPILMRSALPKPSDRRYFDYFMKLEGQSKDEAIIGSTSYLANAMSIASSRDYNSQEIADQEALEYFSENPLPEPGFLGWHPSISSSANKMKFIQHGLNGISSNFHRHGFFESQINELKYRLPDLYEAPLSFQQTVNYSNIRDLLGFSSDIKRKMTENYSLSTKSARANLDYYEGTTFYAQDLIK